MSDEQRTSNPSCACVYATAENTPSVRSGHEMGGYVKEFCESCKEREREQAKGLTALPLKSVQRDADRWRFLCSLPTDDWLKLAVVADNEIDAAIDQLKLKREPTGCLMRADYRAPVTKSEHTAHEPKAALTFDTFFQRVRETGWNPSPDELRALLKTSEPPSEHRVWSLVDEYLRSHFRNNIERGVLREFAGWAYTSRLSTTKVAAPVPPSELRSALRDSRRYVEAYTPRDVSEAHDRDLLLNSIDALLISSVQDET